MNTIVLIACGIFFMGWYICGVVLAAGSNIVGLRSTNIFYPRKMSQCFLYGPIGLIAFVGASIFGFINKFKIEDFFALLFILSVISFFVLLSLNY